MKCLREGSTEAILSTEVVEYTLNNSKAEAGRKYGVHRKLVQT